MLLSFSPGGYLESCSWFSGSGFYFFCSIGVGRSSGSGIFYSGSGIFHSGSGFCCYLLGLLSSNFLELVNDVVQLVNVQWASASCLVSVMGSVLCSVWGSVSVVTRTVSISTINKNSTHEMTIKRYWVAWIVPKLSRSYSWPLNC